VISALMALFQTGWTTQPQPCHSDYLQVAINWHSKHFTNIGPDSGIAAEGFEIDNTQDNKD